jgi:hypothetical protein
MSAQWNGGGAKEVCSLITSYFKKASDNYSWTAGEVAYVHFLRIKREGNVRTT